MILGMSIAAFTQVHVALSLIGIASGLIVVFGMIGGRRLPALTAIFLIATAATSVTGFLFPFKGVTPGIAIGILSTAVLLLAAIARYGGHLRGVWRGTWVIAAILALYFNFFVLIVQSFEKVPALRRLAPTQSAMPFKLTQLVALAGFIVLTVLAIKGFRPGEPSGA